MPEPFASSGLRGPSRDTVSGPRHSQPPGFFVPPEEYYEPAVVSIDGKVAERLLPGDTLEIHTEKCGAASAVLFIMVGGLALAAGVLSGLFVFWSVFGFGWLSM